MATLQLNRIPMFMKSVCFALIVFGGISSQLAFHDAERPASNTAEAVNESLAICSFNIQFLGNSARRDHAALALILRDCDVVVVQELLAPPVDGQFPDGSDFRPVGRAAAFFTAMAALGFEHELSVEDTGSGDKNHNNGTATEWWVAFYKPDQVSIADDLPTEFLAEDRTDHEHYERVPYAFAFRTPDGNLDFVLISVHLQPGGSKKNKARRKEELTAIADWIDQHDEQEKDFIILGDMNIEDLDELRETTPAGFRSLNDQCEATNTNVNGPKPYDHVMYRPRFTREIDKKFDFRVFNLIEAMRPYWNSSEPYPGGSVNPIGLPQYDHKQFRLFYSDHHPVMFKMTVPATDDD